MALKLEPLKKPKVDDRVVTSPTSTTPAALISPAAVIVRFPNACSEPPRSILLLAAVRKVFSPWVVDEAPETMDEPVTELISPKSLLPMFTDRPVVGVAAPA